MDPIYSQPPRNALTLKHAAKIHRTMVKLVLDQRPRSVLEVGCGAGIVGSILSDHGIRYVGIDPDDESLSQAKEHFPHLDVRKGSCYDDPALLHLGTFDLVCSNDVIEHVYEPRKFMTFVRAHLTKEGRFVCGTPDYGNYTHNLVLSIFDRWDHHHNPLWDGGHIKFFSRQTLAQLFDECGFKIDHWKSLGSSHVPIMRSGMFCVALLK